MSPIKAANLSMAIRVAGHPIHLSPEDYDPLMEAVGDSRFVLLGEATHGTREFYRERALITRRLIEEKEIDAVAVEADWPDAWKVNRFVKGEGDPLQGADPLEAFRRFPQWMWRNAEVLDFVLWLRQWNDSLPPGRPKTGFYGLDLYGLHASIEAVLAYLDQVDPEAAARARGRYGCFEGGFAKDGGRYGYEAALGLAKPCEREALDQLLELRRRAAGQAEAVPPVDGDDFFQAEQNAILIVNAERYYRTMFSGRVASWNLRDRHMSDTLDSLAAHLGGVRGRPARMAVWEHNSHLGDARATESADEGEFNVGQLVRERHGGDAFLVGFTTYEGSVMASSDWGELGWVQELRPALPGSCEDIFHQAGLDRFLLDLRSGEVAHELGKPRLHRAVGVVYRPESERASHYMRTRLASQFDMVVHIDRTHAVEPLGPPENRDQEVPETFPSAV